MQITLSYHTGTNDTVIKLIKYAINISPKTFDTVLEKHLHFC